MKTTRVLMLLVFLIGMAVANDAKAQSCSFLVRNSTSCTFSFSVGYLDANNNFTSSGPYTVGPLGNYTVSLSNCNGVVHLRVYDASGGSNDGNVGTNINVFTDSVGDCNNGTATVDWINSQNGWIH